MFPQSTLNITKGSAATRRHKKQDPYVAEEQRGRGRLRVGNLNDTASSAEPCNVQISNIAAKHEVLHVKAHAAAEEEVQTCGDPIVPKYQLEGFAKEELREGMGKEVAMMNDSDAAECLPISELAEDDASSALTSTRVPFWKGSAARARLLQGFQQPVNGLDSFRTDAFCLTMLKLLTRWSLSFG